MVLGLGLSLKIESRKLFNGDSVSCGGSAGNGESACSVSEYSANSAGQVSAPNAVVTNDWPASDCNWLREEIRLGITTGYEKSLQIHTR